MGAIAGISVVAEQMLKIFEEENLSREEIIETLRCWANMRKKEIVGERIA